MKSKNEEEYRVAWARLAEHKELAERDRGRAVAAVREAEERHRHYEEQIMSIRQSQATQSAFGPQKRVRRVPDAMYSPYHGVTSVPVGSSLSREERVFSDELKRQEQQEQ
eukprot:6384643-Pyramimonas_sp.AAC.1